MKKLIVSLLCIYSLSLYAAKGKEGGNGQLVVIPKGHTKPVPYEAVRAWETGVFRNFYRLPQVNGNYEPRRKFNKAYGVHAIEWLDMLKGLSGKMYRDLIKAAKTTRFRIVNEYIHWEHKPYPAGELAYKKYEKAAFYNGEIILSTPVMDRVGPLKKYLTKEENQGFIVVHELINAAYPELTVAQKLDLGEALIRVKAFNSTEEDFMYSLISVSPYFVSFEDDRESTLERIDEVLNYAKDELSKKRLKTLRRIVECFDSKKTLLANYAKLVEKYKELFDYKTGKSRKEKYPYVSHVMSSFFIAYLDYLKVLGADKNFMKLELNDFIELSKNGKESLGRLYLYFFLDPVYAELRNREIYTWGLKEKIKEYRQKAILENFLSELGDKYKKSLLAMEKAKLILLYTSFFKKYDSNENRINEEIIRASEHLEDRNNISYYKLGYRWEIKEKLGDKYEAVRERIFKEVEAAIEKRISNVDIERTKHFYEWASSDRNMENWVFPFKKNDRLLRIGETSEKLYSGIVSRVKSSRKKMKVKYNDKETVRYVVSRASQKEYEIDINFRHMLMLK